MTILKDPELRDLVEDAPELAAVADAIAATQRAPRRPARRAAILGAATLAVAAIALAVVLPFRGGGVDVVGRALAAVGDKPVIHAIVEQRSSADVVVDLATGRERQRIRRTEYWYDGNRKELHTRLSTDGAMLTEIVETPDRGYSDLGTFVTGRGFVPQLDPALGGFVTRYREALADGTAELAGDTTVGGRAAKLIRIRLEHGGGVEEVAVDATTYVPLSFHMIFPGERRSPEFRVVRIESLAREPSFFAPPRLAPPRPTGGSATEGHEIALADARRALGARPLWLGSTFGQRRVESVRLVPVRADWTDGRKTEGLVLRISYGDVEVSEAVDPAGAYAIGFNDGGDPTPTEGSMAVTAERGRRPRQGELRVNGVDTLLVAPDEETLVRAARALSPLQ